MDLNEYCWKCGNPIDSGSIIHSNQQGIANDEFHGIITMFEPEIFEKIKRLDITKEMESELLKVLKDIPPNERIQYLDDLLSPSTSEDDQF
nr:hypothetical protein [Candidatus Sigynarchaeota archaeon]